MAGEVKGCWKRTALGMRVVPLSGLLLSICLLASACRTVDRDRPVSREQDPMVLVSPEQRIGQITWLNPGRDYAVVRLDFRFDLSESFLLVRNRDREVVAVLLAEAAPEGRTTGATLVEGQLQVGQEVVLPGEDWTNHLYRRYRGRSPAFR